MSDAGWEGFFLKKRASGEYAGGGGVCQWVWGCVERYSLCAEMPEVEDLVMRGNTCEKERMFVKAELRGLTV